jgi:adenosylcobinamide-GDP ribazoletransferase
VTTLTIAPLRGPASLDRRAAGQAMTLAPLVGAAVGLGQAAVGLAATALGASALIGAVLTIATGALLTRGLHLDGLADTVDGLGSFRDRDAALAIMRKPDIGPFGVVALVLVLLAQVASAAVLLGRAWPAALTGIVAAAAGGRVAIALACRRGVPAARPDGLGALVAGTVSPAAVVVAAAATAALAVPAAPGRPWLGPAAVGASMLVALQLLRNVTKRLGGVTGDILGAESELAMTVIYLVASM